MAIKTSKMDHIIDLCLDNLSIFDVFMAIEVGTYSYLIKILRQALLFLLDQVNPNILQ